MFCTTVDDIVAISTKKIVIFASTRNRKMLNPHKLDEIEDDQLAIK